MPSFWAQGIWVRSHVMVFDSEADFEESVIGTYG